MKQMIKLIFGVVFFVACAVQADLYTAENVEMAGKGMTPVEAKENAIKAAELAGFTQMIRSLIGGQDEAFFVRPSDEEILEMVRDISILDEKNTSTTYWGKMNVRFQKKQVQELLKKNKLSYLQKAMPTYWLIPIWRQGADRWTLEDENPFYQTLKMVSPLSDSFQMILPNGDVDELVLTERALEAQDFTDMGMMTHSNKAERLLVIDVQYDLDGHWKMTLPSYAGTENIFDGLSVEGIGKDSLQDGWQRLNVKMAARWQEKYRLSEDISETYYARFHLIQLTDWVPLKQKLEKLNFLENLTLQGAMSGQILLSFNYSGGVDELSRQLNQAGFIWQADSDTLGTLKQKDTDEDIL